jgi:hypothetical protein
MASNEGPASDGFTSGSWASAAVDSSDSTGLASAGGAGGGGTAFGAVAGALGTGFGAAAGGGGGLAIWAQLIFAPLGITALFFCAVITPAGGATLGVDEGALSQPVALAAASVSLTDGASPHPPLALNSSAWLGGGGAVDSVSFSVGDATSAFDAVAGAAGSADVTDAGGPAPHAPAITGATDSSLTGETVASSTSEEVVASASPRLDGPGAAPPR